MPVQITRHKRTCRILAAVCAIITLLAITVSPALALDAGHDIISTAAETTPPFSVSTGDNITFQVTAELQPNDALPDEIELTIHTCLQFIGVTDIRIYDTNHQQLDYTGISGVRTRENIAQIFLDTLPENTARIELDYTCTAGEILSNGRSGMSNRARVITHMEDARINISDSIEVESPRVYTWYMELWTIDDNKPRQITTTSSDSKNNGTTYGPDTHPGQSVEGARFKIYDNASLINPLCFIEGFRTYKVCPEAMAKHVDEIFIDDGGKITITGLKFGEYWIQEIAPADGYDMVTTEPIKITFAPDEDELPTVKLINLYNDATMENERIETRNGPQILINYQKTRPADIFSFIALTVLVLTGASILVIKSIFKKQRKDG